MSKFSGEIVSEVERLMFSLHHEPMPDYEWTEEKINELLTKMRNETLDEAAKLAEEFDASHWVGGPYDTDMSEEDCWTGCHIAEELRKLKGDENGK